MSAAIDFHHFIGRFNSTDFAHSISQRLDVIHTWFQGLRVWSQAHDIPPTGSGHASRVVFA
jgi:hypothetical protein